MSDWNIKENRVNYNGTHWEVSNEVWTFKCDSEAQARLLLGAINRFSSDGWTGDAAKSFIACCAGALAFIVEGSGPVFRRSITESLRGTLANAARLGLLRD